MVSAQEEFVAFLEETPEFYAIMKSYTFIKVLKSIALRSKTLNELILEFPSIEEKDLLLVLNSLLDINSIRKLKIKENIVYFLTPKGRLFLEKYDKTKEKFFG